MFLEKIQTKSRQTLCRFKMCRNMPFKIKKIADLHTYTDAQTFALSGSKVNFGDVSAGQKGRWSDLKPLSFHNNIV